MLDATECVAEQIRPGPDWRPWHCGRPRCLNVVGWVRGAEMVINSASTKFSVHEGIRAWVMCCCGWLNDWHTSSSE